jgi:branched-chain amino acid transport system ATP-binding protein
LPDAADLAASSKLERHVNELAATGVSVEFEGLVAVNGVDLSVTEGETVGLIGPNGAGKTTLVNVMSGFQRPTSGELRISGGPVHRWSPQAFVRLGVARTFQGGRPFRRLTALENVEAGALGVGLRSRAARTLAWELLDVFGLTDRASALAGNLPYGEERRLGIARALATSPTFLLLDEPAAGLNDGETDHLVATLRRVQSAHGCAMLVIEHDMRLIRELPDRIYVLDEGAVIAEGPTHEVMKDAAVVAAYLGQTKPLVA